MIRVSSADEEKRQDIIHRLRHYRSMVANYQACQELYDMMFPSGTGTISDMPKVQSDTFEPERWAIRRWDQSIRMQKSLDEMSDALTDLRNLVNSVTGDYNTVLTRRYFLNESWEAIAIKMNYCESQVYKLHTRAINEIVQSHPKNK